MNCDNEDLLSLLQLYVLIIAADLQLVVNLSEGWSVGRSERPTVSHQSVHVRRAELRLLQSTVPLNQLKHLQQQPIIDTQSTQLRTYA